MNDDLNNQYNGIYDLSAKGGIDEFNFRFLANMENIYYADVIKGADIVQEWVDTVYLRLSEKEMNDVPALYRVIHDLSISKEELIALNDELMSFNEKSEDAISSMCFEPYIIDALFNDDIAEMKRVLVAENAFFYDGEIYTWTQVRKAVNAGTISELGLPKYALLSFADERLAEFSQIQSEWSGYQADAQREYNEYRAYINSVSRSNEFSADAGIEPDAFSFSSQRGIGQNDWRFHFESEEAYFEYWQSHIEQVLDFYNYHLQEARDVMASINSVDLY